MSTVQHHFVRKPKAGRGLGTGESRCGPADQRACGVGRKSRRAVLADDVFPLPLGPVAFGWTGLLRGGRGKIVCSGGAQCTGR